jgi:hypothetical protein
MKLFIMKLIQRIIGREIEANGNDVAGAVIEENPNDFFSHRSLDTTSLVPL